MHTAGHDPHDFHGSLGFVDTLTLLILASAVGLTLTMIVLAVASWMMA
jgi:hypothetical protein